MRYLISYFIINRCGWRGAFLVIGGLTFNMVVAGALLRPLPKKQKQPGKRLQDDFRMKELEKDVTDVDTTDQLSTLQRFWRALTVSLGLRLLHTEKYLLIYMAGFVLFRISSSAWSLFLVSYALSKGLTPLEAALLSSFGGLGNLLGRIVNGPIIDWKIITAAGMWSLLAFTTAVGFALHAYVNSFVGLSVLSVVTGMCLGARYSVAIVVMKENVRDMMAFKSAIGWCFFFQGAGVAIGTPLTGESPGTGQGGCDGRGGQEGKGGENGEEEGGGSKS